MAHYAYIDENNIVTAVIVGPDEGTEPEDIESWEEYCSAKGKGRAVRTSYNGKIRFNYAGIGFEYREDLDAFIPPKPFESSILNEDTCRWEAPVERPTEGDWVWDEQAGAWKEVTNV